MFVTFDNPSSVGKNLSKIRFIREFIIELNDTSCNAQKTPIEHFDNCTFTDVVKTAKQKHHLNC